MSELTVVAAASLQQQLQHSSSSSDGGINNWSSSRNGRKNYRRGSAPGDPVAGGGGDEGGSTKASDRSLYVEIEQQPSPGVDSALGSSSSGGGGGGDGHCDGGDTNGTQSTTSVTTTDLSPSYSSASTDSGTAAAMALAEKNDQSITYVFEMPEETVGMLIGGRGRHVKYLQDVTDTSVSILNSVLDAKKRICCIVGTEKGVNGCLRLIRKRFPLSQYPNLKLTPILYSQFPNLASYPVSLYVAQVPEFAVLQLDLVPGTRIETIVCSTYSPDHFFVHQPTHPSYMHLGEFQSMLNALYENDDTIPNIHPVVVGSKCVVLSDNGWCRASVCDLLVKDDASESIAVVRLLDYGGYFNLPLSGLKQMRVECTYLPVQAYEVILTGVSPTRDEWSKDAVDYFTEVTRSVVLYTETIEALPCGAKLSNVYFLNHQSLAAMMIANGYAKHFPATCDSHDNCTTAEHSLQV